MIVVVAIVVTSLGLGRSAVPLFWPLVVIGAWLYYAIMESSKPQATIGKMALGTKVTTLGGERIGFGRASGRYFGKIVSGLTLGIGYLMAAFTERRQALHADRRIPWWFELAERSGDCDGRLADRRSAAS